MTNQRGHSYWKLKIEKILKILTKIESFCQHWKNMKNIYPNQSKWWDMAKHYIQGITKDFCIEFKEKQTELLV